MTSVTCPHCDAARPDWGWTDDPRLGALVVGDQYRVLRRLGAGGFGIVYEVETVVGGLRRALKVLSSEWLGNEQMRERFVNEAVVLEQVNHPNVARCYACGTLEPEGALYLLLELAEGSPLSKRLRDERTKVPTPLPASEAIRIARQVGSGLVAAHANGVLHRDLKPDNILVHDHDGGQSVKVIDFGIAKFTTRGEAVTQTILGTPQFMAPEQFRPGEPIDVGVDIWQLGATLFSMLTGHPPFGRDDASVSGLLDEHKEYGSNGPFPSTVTEALSAHPALDNLVSRMLASDRKKRPRSAAEVCEALARIEHALEPGSAQTSSLTLLETLCTQPGESAWWALLRFLHARADDQAMLVTIAETRLEGWPAELRRAPCSWWERVRAGEKLALWPLARSLDLSCRELDDDAIETLAACEQMSKIVQLDLSGNAIDNAGAIALANSDHLHAIEVLSLSTNRISSAGVEAIAQSTKLPHLRKLRLAENGVGARGLAALAGTKLPLTELDLSDNGFGTLAAERIA
jgi:serine/threonine protein kinase